MEKSIKSVSINYGIYLGIILSAATVIAYAINLELFTKWWFGIILLVVIISVGIVSTAKAKSLGKGFISFKEAFSAFFIPIAVGVLISSLVSVVLFNFVDPEAAEMVKEQTIENSVKMMEGFGAPQTAIDEAVAEMQNTNQFSIVSLLKSYAWQMLFYAVVGLIVGAIMKRKDPNAE